MIQTICDQASSAKRHQTRRLSGRDRQKIEAITSSGEIAVRILKRLRVLTLLADGWAPSDVPAAVGCGEANVRRTRQRFEQGGLTAVLEDRPRPGRQRSTTDAVEARIVAMVCSSPPDGRSRWTVRLVADEVVERGIVKRISREKIRLILCDHDLKPWREKNVVRSSSG
jgi:putative transposase